jgi:hypothetical protein
VVWGSPIELGAQDRVRQLRDGCCEPACFRAFEMSEANLDRFVAEIRRTRPRMIFGYPSALVHIADHAGRWRQRLDDVGIEVAFVTSERLYDHQRERIAPRSAAASPTATGAGTRFRRPRMPEGGMHLSAEDVIVEIVDAGGNALPPGRPGEIVVTHLSTRDFPFDPLRTGDIAALDDRACPCGRGLPMLREIQGRSTDFVVAENGTVMHGLARSSTSFATCRRSRRSRSSRNPAEGPRSWWSRNAPIADDVAASILSGFQGATGCGRGRGHRPCRGDTSGKVGQVPLRGEPGRAVIDAGIGRSLRKARG